MPSGKPTVRTLRDLNPGNSGHYGAQKILAPNISLFYDPPHGAQLLIENFQEIEGAYIP